MTKPNVPDPSDERVIRKIMLDRSAPVTIPKPDAVVEEPRYKSWWQDQIGKMVEKPR